MNATGEAGSAADAPEPGCLACTHAKSRHAQWHPTFVGCYACDQCPGCTPPEAEPTRGSD